VVCLRACQPFSFTPGTGTGQTLNSPSDRLRGTVWGVFVTWGMAVDWLWFVVEGSRETWRLSGKVGLAVWNEQSLSYRGHLVGFPRPEPPAADPESPHLAKQEGWGTGTLYQILGFDPFSSSCNYITRVIIHSTVPMA
jgi:hypothetical protein